MNIFSFNRFLLIAICILIAHHISAQQFSSAFFTDGYLYQHELNPALESKQNYVALPGLGNINAKVQGNFGLSDVVLDNPMYPEQSNDKLTSFLNPYINVSDALNGFSKGNNRLLVNSDIAIIGLGFKGMGGYNTFGIKLRSQAGLSIPYELFEFAKNTGNQQYHIGDVNMSLMSYAEFALGHSRDINERLRLGAKLKLLFGVGRADLQMKDMKADLVGDAWSVSGKVMANVSLKKFAFESEEREYESRAETYQRITDIDVDGVGISGFGMAVDLGMQYKINKDWTLSASLLDLGFISWNNDFLAKNKHNTVTFDGFHDVSVKEERDNNTFEHQGDSYLDQLTDFANLQDLGDKGGRTTGIGATLNVGATYNLPVYRPLTFGVLSTTRLNGSYSWTEGRLSANYAPLKWLDGGVNFAINSFTASMGWVLNIHPTGYNLFVGMDHIIGKLSKQGIPKNANLNLVLGMNICW